MGARRYGRKIGMAAFSEIFYQGQEESTGPHYLFSLGMREFNAEQATNYEM